MSAPRSAADAVTALILQGVPAQEAARQLGLPTMLIDGEYGPAVVIGRLSAEQVAWAHRFILTTLEARGVGREA